MGESDQRDLIRVLLNKHWRVRAEVVGKQSVEDLLAAVEEGTPPDEIFRSTEGGRSFDMLQTLQVLAQAAILLKACVEIFNLLRTALGRKPTAAELEEEVKAKGALNQVTDEGVKGMVPAILEDLAHS